MERHGHEGGEGEERHVVVARHDLVVVGWLCHDLVVVGVGDLCHIRRGACGGRLPLLPGPLDSSKLGRQELEDAVGTMVLEGAGALERPGALEGPGWWR